MDAPMWVVIEWNQAGGRPSLAVDNLFETWAEARVCADDAKRDTASVGRGETYSVHEVEMGGADR